MNERLINLVEAQYRKSDLPDFRIGQSVSIHVKIVEGGKERIQQFIGVVIARKGRGLSETFTVRRIVANQGVERTFQLHSPKIIKVEIMRTGKVRRAKLYYLRERLGKSRKLREKRIKRGETAPASHSVTANSEAGQQELATVET